MITTRQRIHTYIKDNPDTTVNEIAAAMGVTRSCVSPQVSNLFRDGLLTRSVFNQGYRYAAIGTITEPAAALALHMSEGMALFNKLLKGVRA
jgi:DNA-binding MarR family transcriptional regulator